jgi:hypothetical protein
MRRRLPSPALVIASVALFVALAGSGVAASLFLVRAPKPVMLVPASVSADGKVTGAGAHGQREGVGDYTITIRGDTFAPTATRLSVQSSVSPVITISGSGLRNSPPICNIASETLGSNGSATAHVLCYSLDNGVTWEPQDVSFDFQMVGPSR